MKSDTSLQLKTVLNPRQIINDQVQFGLLNRGL